MNFKDLNLHPQLNAGIEQLNYNNCTPIQEATIPHILSGRDVAGLAQTGTGKTAAFLVPLIDRVLRSIDNQPQSPDLPTRPLFTEWKNTHFILVVCPTRELAEQIFANFKKLAAETQLKGVAVYGGASSDAQISAINRGTQFIFATPGRLIDLYKEQTIDLHQVRAVVFDEADRMFDMGFKDDMRYLLRRIPRDRQYLVFSATLNFDVLNVAYENGADPIECNISKDQAKAENVKDEIFHVGHDEKPKYLLSLLQKQQPKQTIIFSNFKNNVERLVQFLNENQWPAIGISSLLTQNQRNRVMEQFKSVNEKNILVATDLAARGLDIKGVDLVINFELPDDPENYIHRIGRTGRAGEEGHAYSLVSDRDVDALQRIENYTGHKVIIGWIEDKELVQSFKYMKADNQPFSQSWNSHGKVKGKGRYSPRVQTKGRRSKEDFRDQRNKNKSPHSQDTFTEHQRKKTERPQASPFKKHKSQPFKKRVNNKPANGHVEPKVKSKGTNEVIKKLSSHHAPKKKISEKVAKFFKGLFKATK